MSPASLASVPLGRCGWFVCACLTLLLWSFPAHAIVVDGASLHDVIDSDISYFIEDEGLNVFEVSQLGATDWVSVEGEINFGYNPKAYWFRVPVKYTGMQALERILVIDYPLLDNITIHVFSDDELKYSAAAGDTLPFYHRPIEHRFFIFPLSFEPTSEYTLYLKVETEGAIQVPLSIWEEHHFYANDLSLSAFDFMYFGILMIMAAFNLMLFFIIRDNTFITYVFFVSCILLLMTSINGYAFQYVLFDYPRFHEMLVLLIVPLTEASICVFTLHFLKLSQHGVAWYRGFLFFILISCLCMIGALVLPYGISTRISVVFMLPIAIFAMIAGLRFWQTGDYSARLFTVAWVAILLGVAIAVLNRLGVVPSMFVVDYGIQLSTTAQTLLLSLALAARFNSEREARMRAQDEYVSEIRKRRDAETQLVYSASHQEVTGLPNRVLLEKSIRAYFDDYKQRQDHLMVVLLHVRRFDDVNKTLGHRNADVLLRRVGERINSVLSKARGCLCIEEKGDDHIYVSHVEGVSFCFCLTGENKEGLLNEVENRLEKMGDPIEFMGLALEVSFLVGCSFDENSSDPQTLLRQAFIAFDKANTRLSTLAIYEADMNPYSPKRLTLMTELRSAIEYDGLALFFQPQIDLKNERVCGFEALLRWTHHDFGFVPPDEFIPMAEKTGLMKSLTRWVLIEAAKFCKLLQDAGCEACVSINISALNLREPKFSEQLVEILDETKVGHDRIALEVTETAAMIDPESALQVMESLNTAGVRLSIDDFGTGHSSLSYIRRLPVQEIKIDRSFVGDMDSNPGDATIVKTTINMCHDLGFEVVAEGVENEEILKMLDGMGCDIIQGYHIARPMPAADMLHWLTETDWKK